MKDCGLEIVNVDVVMDDVVFVGIGFVMDDIWFDIIVSYLNGEIMGMMILVKRVWS